MHADSGCRIERFAYLRTADKVRAAVINDGGPRYSIEHIENRLASLPTGMVRISVPEPRDSDAEDFRVAGLVRCRQVTPPKPRFVTSDERRRLERIAREIADRPDAKEPEKVARGRIPLAGTMHAQALVLQVCEALEIPRDDFMGKSRKKHLIAARSLVVRLLRDRNAALYSFPRLAEIVGRGDHSTAINLLKKFDRLCEMFPQVAALYLKLSDGAQ